MNRKTFGHNTSDVSESEQMVAKHLLWRKDLATALMEGENKAGPPHAWLEVVSITCVVCYEV